MNTTIKKPSTNKIDEKLLQVLVCPLSKEKLIYENLTNKLISKKEGLAYSIKNGIPILIPEQAKKI